MCHASVLSLGWHTGNTLASKDLQEDAKRFQSWQLDALRKHPPGTELRSFGPFRAIIPGENQAGGWVTVVDGRVTERETTAAIADLRDAFNERKTPLEIEYNEALLPRVGAWLDAAGFTLAERNPLMACRPEGFKPFGAGGVTLQQLTPSSEAADMQV